MFPRTTPESVGLPSAAVLAFLDRLEKEDHDPHSLIVLRDGKAVVEGWWAPYGRDRVHRLYSLSKSFTSTAIGMAIEEGRLSLTDRVVDFFPQETPAEPSANLLAMTVRDLLTMTAGHDSDDRADMNAEPDGVWMRAFLRRPVPYAPGTHFLYNSSATYALSAILHRLTGGPLLDYLRLRLFEPLNLGPARWETDPQGINVGGWGLYITTDAIARFGQFLLQKGRWEGRQLVSAAWIEEATSAQVDNSPNVNPDWRQGYGYQFWTSRHGFRGDGAFGQFCLVLPDQRLVVAITSASNDLQGVLNAVWEELLDPLSDQPLKKDPAAEERLRTRLADLAIPSPETERSSTVHLATSEGPLAIGVGEWIESPRGLGELLPAPIAARGAWRKDGCFEMKIQAVESTESIVATLDPLDAGALDFQARGTWVPTKGRLIL